MNKTREAVQRVLTDFFFNKDNVEKDWADTIIQTMIENWWGQKSDHVTDTDKMVTSITMRNEWEKCPTCGGPADNGNDRCVPPNAYECSKCEAETQKPPQGEGSANEKVFYVGNKEKDVSAGYARADERNAFKKEIRAIITTIQL